MLSVFMLKDNATLASIRKNLIDQAGKDWAIASLYVALSRLKKNGYVKSFFGDPTQERGGKAQKYFLLTDLGLEQLKETKRLQDNMWREFSSIIPESE